ncbi:MAG: ATP-binding protein [Acidobacteriota bacterium]
MAHNVRAPDASTTPALDAHPVSGAAEFADAIPSADDRLQEAARRALLERPSVSIRARIALAFLLLLALSGGSVLASWFLLSQAQRKLDLLVVVDRLTIEVQQARRFEKNYLLYGTNLADALEHARQASELLAAHLAGGERDPALSERTLATLARDLGQYEDLLTSLARGAHDPTVSTAAQDRDELVARVRDRGARTTSDVLQMAADERRSVQDTLNVAKRIPLVLLAVTLVLAVYVANFLGRQIVGPLTRFVDVTQRIASGDFTPLMPARRYRDEFSNLSLAINRMLQELEHRYQVMVESHKLRAVGTLTAGIAHELNNPLNNITLTASTLRQFHSKLDEPQRLEMLDELVAEADRSQKIVRNLLDFTRQTETAIEPLNLRSLIQDVVGLAQNQVKLHGCTLELHVPPDLPAIHGDRNLLRQVFLNLLLNALDAIDKGGRIQVTADAGREPGFVVTDVADNGTGIPPHMIGAIFDPFFTTKATGKGTGLGLSMSRGIVRQHGGDIRVRSRPGAGSTFSVLLPSTQVEAQIPAGARVP